MRLSFDEDSLEAALEKMSDAPMTTIESLRVKAVQLAHPSRKSGLGRLDEEVIVVSH